MLGNAGPYSYACFPGQVPDELDDKTKKEIQLRVGDDVAAAESSGHLEKAELLLEIGNWSVGDELSAELNDDVLEAGDPQPVPREPATSEEPAFHLRYPVKGSQVRQGMNQLHVASQREKAPGDTLTLRRVELEVRYR